MNEARFSSKLLIVAALASVAALAAAIPLASASGAAGPRAAAASSPPCKTSGLVIWSNNGAGGGTAGSVFYKIRFTNLSGHACTLKGFPKVSAVNLAGKRIGSAAQQEAGQKPKLRKLANGATATALLRVVDPGNFSPSACHEVTAAGLRVTPPGQSHSKLIPLPFATCSRAGQKTLSVGVIQ
ncbi:MAG TPA: DUF4232 domain-containing protein [Solirubrobacterales bacterium]|jgi:hypothetical protein|nr:DUF4232 domain-containing protein [Solirubrobacterales bacterium]